MTSGEQQPQVDTGSNGLTAIAQAVLWRREPWQCLGEVTADELKGGNADLTATAIAQAGIELDIKGDENARRALCGKCLSGCAMRVKPGTDIVESMRIDDCNPQRFGDVTLRQHPLAG